MDHGNDRRSRENAERKARLLPYLMLVVGLATVLTVNWYSTLSG
jgi:hypothetical protein